MLPALFKRLVLLGLLAAAVSCSPAPSSSPPPTSTSDPATTSADPIKTIVLADASKDPRKKIKRFQPLADYLATNLKEFDITAGEVQIAPDLETIIQWLKEGKVDLYFDSPYPAMLAIEQAGAKPILRRWKNGDAEYYTIIFTMADREIDSLADLRGKMVAFDDERSTTGYMLPLAHFLEAGLEPVEKSAVNVTLAEDEVGYVFSNDDDNTTEWVISGKTTAGALDIQTFEKIPEEIRAKMKILAESEKVARNIVLVRADMDPEQIEAIKAILLAMDKNPEGQAVLKQFRTAKFDYFPKEAGLTRMEEIYNRIQNR